jgi:hypothetical protein
MTCIRLGSEMNLPRLRSTNFSNEKRPAFSDLTDIVLSKLFKSKYCIITSRDRLAGRFSDRFQSVKENEAVVCCGVYTFPAFLFPFEERSGR